jgi:signal transduction histidine kinase
MLLVFCVCFFPARDTAAQQPFFEEETSPSITAGISLVNGIAADANDCIWLSTQSGIYRYDGNRFRNYSTLNTPAIKFERMEALLTILDRGRLSWCINDAKGNKYEIDSLSHLRPLTLVPGKRMVFGTRHLMSLEQDRLRNIGMPQESVLEVFYSRGQNLFYIRHDDNNIAYIGAAAPPATPAVRTNIKAKYHFATDNGLYSFTSKGVVRLGAPGTAAQVIPLTGDITAGSGTLYYDSIRVFAEPGRPTALAWYRGNIYELAELPGLQQLNSRLLAKGSTDETPSFLYYSSQHQLLVSCFLHKGLVLYRPRHFSLLTYPSERQQAENYYYSLLPSGNGYTTVNSTGIVWLGTDGSSRILSKGAFSLFCIFRDRVGNTWYQRAKSGNVKGYIGYLEAGTNRSVHVYDTREFSNLAGVHQQDDSTYYILLNNAFEKLIRSRNGNRIETLINFPQGEGYNVLYPRSAGVLWLGSDRGLSSFDIATGKLKRIDALENANVRAITKLSDNNYIVGTYDKWIFRYKHGEWLRLVSADKSVASSAHGFIVDHYSNSLWLSSNKGIARLPLQQLIDIDMKGTGEIYAEHFTGFGKGISLEFNGSSNSSAAQVSDSNAAFANASGLAMFDPRFLVSPPLPRKVLVEPVYDDDSLARDQNQQVRFSVSVPYFGNRGNLEVQYRMTNTADSWHKLFPNAIISYDNLSPGDHDLEFRLRHYNSNDDEVVLVKAKSFYIPYRWYQKPWFKWLVTLLAVGLILFIHNFRIWYLRKRKRELEKIVKSKTSELQETNVRLSEVIDDLRESEAHLKQSNYLKDEYYAVLTHDLRSPLKFLSFNLSQLLELLPEMDASKLKKGLIVAFECTNDVHKLVDEFVYWIQNNENLLVPRALPVNISAVTNDIRKLYGFSFEAKKNKLITEVPVDLLFTSDHQMLFIILRNAIDNANKYTTGGNIEVRAKRSGDNLELTVSDTGTGITAELAEQLTQLQYQEVQLDYKKRRSLGFYIMAMLIKKLNGHYTIHTEKGKGTTIHFNIPESKEDQSL